VGLKKEIKNVINRLLTTIISKFVTSKSAAVWFTGSNDHFGIFKLLLQYLLFQISNAVVYVMPFIIGPKTGCHDIAEILLKVALNTINQI
jgi:hypothetical protein